MSATSTVVSSSRPVDGNLACRLLEDAGLTVLWPQSEAYAAREADYYSASAAVGPACIVQPKTAQDVARIVTTLTAHTTAKWAVRGGGHTFWGPAAGSHEAVTIDLGLMRNTEYDSSTQVAKIQGGSLWSDVYSILQPHGVMVPGGRTSTVGVGGFTLGGGNSFYSGQVGLACDNVVNYEVVLADGAIVNANKGENADLWKALKGGSGNFGIVTRFDMQAFGAGDLYGGLVTHPARAGGAILAALSRFVANVGHYPSGSALSFWSWTPGATESVVVSALHDTTGAVAAPAFAEYAAVQPSLASTLRTDTMLNFAIELEFAKGLRNVWFAITVKNDPPTLAFIVEQHDAFIPAWREATGDDNFSLHTILQPLPRALFAHGVARGGNVLGMDRQPADSVLFQVLLVFAAAALEPEARRRLAAYREAVQAFSAGRGADVEFVYLNYADRTQNPIESYGRDNVQFLRTVASKYDPKRIFQTRRSGGFGIPGAI